MTNMKKSIFSLSLATLLSFTANAGDSYTSVLDSHSVSVVKPDICKQAKNALTLVKDPKASFLNELSLTLRGQYQAASVSPNGANKFRPGSGGHDDEWRRAYIGGKAVMFNNKLIFNTMLNIGELDAMHRSWDGRWSRSRRDWSIYELYLQYNFADVGVKVGKIAPFLTREFSVSSSEILTVERTSITNQLDTDSNWGVVVKNVDDQDSLRWDIGVYLNSAGVNLSDEFHFSTENNCFVKGAVTQDTSALMWGEKSEVTLSYMHNFTDFYDRAAPKDRFYAGPGARDVVSASWKMNQGDFYLLTEAVMGLDLANRATGKNVYGFYVIPSYRITPHWEGVFRYQVSLGDDSVQVYNRYIPALTEYPSVVDGLNAFYVGVNYYVCGENPALFRIMLGAEYTTTHTSAADQKGFSGWTYMAAVRFKF